MYMCDLYVCIGVFIVAATLTETRQFYTLYNTLEDQKAYMEKEVSQLVVSLCST